MLRDGELFLKLEKASLTGNSAALSQVVSRGGGGLPV